MSTAKLSSAANRINWLQDVLDGTVNSNSVTAAQLKDVNSFCKVEIENLFTPLSYNTLKSHLKTFPNNHFRNHTFNDNWVYFLYLREKTYSLLLAKDGKTRKTNASATPIDYKLANRNSLWHANLCANAYLQLRRDVQGILRNSSNGELDYKKLEKILNKSWSSYKQIISPETDSPAPSLTIVKATP